MKYEMKWMKTFSWFCLFFLLHFTECSKLLQWSIPRWIRHSSIAISTFVLTAPHSPSQAVIEDVAIVRRFHQAQEELEVLDKDWDKIVNGDGDNIRRRLGTVYRTDGAKCDRALCSFTLFVEKVARGHADNLDIVAYEEESRSLLDALNQADYLAYSSIFSDYGNGGHGENWIGDSHVQVKRALSLMHKVIAIIEAP
eukprot:gene345-370_t